MPDSTVNIYYDGKQVSSTTTSSEGGFDESISVPMDSSVGQIIVRSRFPGTDTYAEANGQETIIVQSDTQLTLTSPTDKNIERNEIYCFWAASKNGENYTITIRTRH